MLLAWRWIPVNFFKFQPCDHTPPGTRMLWFPTECWWSQRNVHQSSAGIVYGWDYDGIWSSSIPQLSFLIEGNVFGQRFRSRWSSIDPRISPLPTEYRDPQAVPITHYFVFITNNVNTQSLVLSHANIFKAKRLLWARYFSQSKRADPHRPTQLRVDRVTAKNKFARVTLRPKSVGLCMICRNPTTSFLTATTLRYATGAGITAAAGTRLALQLFLVKCFKLYSFQLDKS